MATYVFSDVHGHLAPLVRLVERVSPGSDDVMYCLGDMVDRGPDPVGVMKFCREIAPATTLLGNHEELMLASVLAEDDMSWDTWFMNGGATTAHGLAELFDEEGAELLDWVKSCPTAAWVCAGGRPYILVHAGIDPMRVVRPDDGVWSDEALDTLLAAQQPTDELWIRAGYLDHPTGLLDSTGAGPQVVAGHTPTSVVERFADVCDRRAEWGGQLRIVYLGARAETGGVPDRIAIDTGAGSVAGAGRVSMLRLDDGEEFYESFRPGE